MYPVLCNMAHVTASRRNLNAYCASNCSPDSNSSCRGWTDVSEGITDGIGCSLSSSQCSDCSDIDKGRKIVWSLRRHAAVVEWDYCKGSKPAIMKLVVSNLGKHYLNWSQNGSHSWAKPSRCHSYRRVSHDNICPIHICPGRIICSGGIRCLGRDCHIN